MEDEFCNEMALKLIAGILDTRKFLDEPTHDRLKELLGYEMETKLKSVKTEYTKTFVP